MIIVPNGNAARQKLARDIRRMHLMFFAYQYDLSQRGKALAAATEQAHTKVLAGQYDAPEVRRVEVEVLEHLPNPDGTDLLDKSPFSWRHWFITTFGESSGGLAPIGEGCLEPCSHCIAGNGTGWSRSKPLYVIADEVEQSLDVRFHEFPFYFQGVFRNNVTDWLDPFLHFDIGSLAASLALLDHGVIFAPMIKAANIDDPRTGRAVQRIMQIQRQNYQKAIRFSFHLCIGSAGFDLIRAIYEAGCKRIPEEIINRYAERFGKNLTFFGQAIDRILLYGANVSIREGEIEDNLPFDPKNPHDVFNWATRQAFLRALKIAAINPHELPFILTRWPINMGGRGFDFFRRLDRAWQEDARCLDIDHSCIADCDRETPHPRVKCNAAGKVAVVNPQAPTEILVQTTLDELWPLTA